MECNKDEAVRAKEIAERKFSAKEVAGAKKFALKAQCLYPELDGITQMLATFDVYLSAERKVNGESDWYGILGANPTADEDTIRKQFRKLALTLHPDKNKSIGADGAFNLISEAWSFLSDKAKRSAYDQKRRAKIFQKVSNAAAGFHAPPPPPPGANGFYSFKRTATVQKVQKSSTERVASSSQKPKSGTFWTVCHKCKMQFEYLRVYVNQNLLCPNCRVPFYAAEVTPPTVNAAKSSKVWNFAQHHHSQANNGKDTSSARTNNVQSSDHDHSSNQSHWVPFSGSSGASTAAQAASVVQQAYERVKREREELQAATRKHVRRKTSAGSSTAQKSASDGSRGINDGIASKNSANLTNPTWGQSGGAALMFSFTPEQGNSHAGSIGGVNRLQMFREAPQPQVQKILIGKAKKEIHGKVDQVTLAETSRKASSEDTKGDQEPQGKVEILGKMKKGNKASARKSSPTSSDASRGGENGVTLGMNVPNPDFHNFDVERTENAFAENQVWAAYDGDDGMPRYYAIIHKVISLKPFKVRLSWLNSNSNTEFAPLNWVSSGFPKTCGDFRVGKYEMSTSLNSFSHRVRWIKGTKGTVFIFPKKGDIWALYRNWSPDWSKSTAKEIVHKFDMVEVLEDYDEEREMPVAPLVQVDGFRTVFRRNTDPKETQRIPRAEMFRLSHSVPSHLLTSEEAPNAPKGCWDLDPAAIPMDLIRPSANVQEAKNKEERRKTDTAVPKRPRGDIRRKSDETTERTDIEGVLQIGRLYRFGEEHDNVRKLCFLGSLFGFVVICIHHIIIRTATSGGMAF